jgi:hypothetical protein
MSSNQHRSPSVKSKFRLPAEQDWRTTDQDEINKRQFRAQTEDLRITNVNAAYPVFSNFRVRSASGMTYTVEIRDIAKRRFSCDCPDFRRNGLGTCKHTEAVLLHLESRHRQLFRDASMQASPRIDLVPDHVSDTVRIENGLNKMPAKLRALFDLNGHPKSDTAESILEKLQSNIGRHIRVSQEIGPWIESRRHAVERKLLRREYETRVQSGEWPAHETLVPLFPYQREGMLHLAFTERALLADEMGLGKTIQAIAACALLHRLGKARRVLVVTPASLKTEWEEQIQRFTTLPYRLVFGSRQQRLQAYRADAAPFFTIVNYEQMVPDALDVNTQLEPDVVVLDEAQRIKNWNTKTAQAVKRLRSRYAFVLTGTPIENRIDELYSLMDFLNPTVLGPLFRFNRDFYELDDRGKPIGYRNLDVLHQRIRPYMLRRRKADVETELPERTDRNHFVPLGPEQQTRHTDLANRVARILAIGKQRPLTKQEQERLQIYLGMMRMTCDTNYILDDNERTCPKLAELEKILEECRENPDVKVIVFSEWERMLQLVRILCQKLNLGHAWHTGSVPQQRRRDEINLFKDDPQCRVFLSTDSGSTGLNLQNASVVINCDLPWNPARLEQRIARAWRKNQTRPVTVINLVSENSIEHRMLDTLATKKALSDGVLDRIGDIKSLRLVSARQSFLARLEQLVSATTKPSLPVPRPKPMPVDRARALSDQAATLLRANLVRCEERYPLDGSHCVVLIVVERDAAAWRTQLEPLHRDLFGPGQTDPNAPTHLEVIDRTTDEALQRLIESGLVQRTTRATRPLFPQEHADGGIGNLSAEERQKIEAHRQRAARKLKLAELFVNEDFLAEARQSTLDAILAIGQASAIQKRLPAPAVIDDVTRPPLSSLAWGEIFPAIRDFIAANQAPVKPVIDLVQRALNSTGIES